VPAQDSYLTPYGTLSNPFPDGIQQPTGAALGVNTNLGNGVNYYNPNPLTPYSLRWNLSVQRQLSKDAMVELGYLANHSVHLAVDRQLNFVPAQFLSTSAVRDQATIDWLATPVANPFAGLIPGTSLDSKTVSRSQLLQAFPQFSGVNANAMNDGSSYSHILMLRGEKRFSGGLQLQANVQYSRIMQRLSRLNDSDAFLEKRVAPEDRPFRAVLSGSYALPLARGNRFLGGWIISGIYTRQSGAPLEWGNVIYYGGDLQMAPTNIDRAFDTTRFNTNSKQQLAQNVRTFPTAFANLRAAGPDNVDLSIIKDFRIWERLKMQYRCEFFNAFNHPMFDVPDVSPTSSTFGQIQNQANLPRRVQMALRLVW
jgi:hypothetical protein